jgi:hypothetical protein
VRCGVVGVLGLFFAVYFYFKGKERFSLRYDFVERAIIEQKNDRKPFDLDGPVVWNGFLITERLVRTYVFVRNSGNKLIEKSDVVGGATVQTHESAKIIDVQIIAMDDPACSLKISEPQGFSAQIDFEFFRPKEGAIFRVDHTGKQNQLFVSLKTKQGGPAKRVPRAKVERNITVAVIATVSLLGMGALAGPNYGLISESNRDFGYSIVFLGLLSLGVVAAANQVYNSKFMRYYKISTSRVFSLIIADLSIDLPSEFENALNVSSQTSLPSPKHRIE